MAILCFVASLYFVSHIYGIRYEQLGVFELIAYAALGIVLSSQRWALSAIALALGGLALVEQLILLALCLQYFNTSDNGQIIGDSITSDAVIFGGLVPTLLYQDIEPAPEIGAHVGTADIDLALDLVILDKDRYEDVASSLKDNGFLPDTNQQGNMTRQRWRAKAGAQVDFLMPPVPPDAIGGKQQPLTKDLAAFTMRGLDLALKTRKVITLSGKDLEGRSVERELPVCSPEIFVALKGLAIAGRMKPKDAYDIHYVLLHDPLGAAGLGKALHEHQANDAIDAAVKALRRDYKEVDSRDPPTSAHFSAEVATKTWQVARSHICWNSWHRLTD